MIEIMNFSNDEKMLEFQQYYADLPSDKKNNYIFVCANCGQKHMKMKNVHFMGEIIFSDGDTEQKIKDSHILCNKCHDGIWGKDEF